MEQENILSCGIEELYTLKENLLELEGHKARSQELDSSADKLEQEIAAKEEAIKEEIANVTKKRKEQITDSYKEQLDRLLARTKKVELKKSKQLKKNKSERIKDETSGLLEQIRLKKEENKALMKREHIPAICNSTIYDTIFSPSSIADYIRLVAYVLAVFLLIPSAVYFLLLKGKKALYLIIIYVVIILLLILTLSIIRRMLNTVSTKALASLKLERTEIKKINRKIRSIRKSIEKDKDESSYDVSSYTEEIEDLEGKLKELETQKKEALLVFENTTRLIIAREISAREEEALNTLKNQHMAVHEENLKEEEQVKQRSLMLANRYEGFFGKELLTLEKVDALIKIMEENQYSTISKAITAFQQGID